MNTEIIIHAHGGAQAIFDRHVPLWKRHALPIRVICPEDDIAHHGFPGFNYGLAGPIGVNAYKRWIYTLTYMASQRNTRFILFEYDAFCLSAQIPEGMGVKGVMHQNVEGARFIAHQYPGFPMSIDSKSAAKMLTVANEYWDMMEEGYIDRMYAALAMLAGVPVTQWTPRGICFNTISEADIPALKYAIGQGAVMIHGVKSEVVFNECVKHLK